MNKQPRPRTPAQIEASRRNGAKSRGPRSAEGRKRSSQNSRTHGLTARIDVVLDHEDRKLFDQTLDAYIRAYMPASPLESQLVAEIAKCAWRLDRISNIEASLLNLEVDRQRDYVREQFTRISDNDRIAIAFSAIANRATDLPLLCRYESGCRRGLLASSNTLARIQNERRRLDRIHSQASETSNLRNEPGGQVRNAPILADRFDFLDSSPSRVPSGFPPSEPAGNRNHE